jgi:hypothetical protein
MNIKALGINIIFIILDGYFGSILEYKAGMLDKKSDTIQCYAAGARLQAIVYDVSLRQNLEGEVLAPALHQGDLPKGARSQDGHLFQLAQQYLNRRKARQDVPKIF